MCIMQYMRQYITSCVSCDCSQPLWSNNNIRRNGFFCGIEILSDLPAASVLTPASEVTLKHILAHCDIYPLFLFSGQ